MLQIKSDLFHFPKWMTQKLRKAKRTRRQKRITECVRILSNCHLRTCVFVCLYVCVYTLCTHNKLNQFNQNICTCHSLFHSFIHSLILKVYPPCPTTYIPIHTERLTSPRITMYYCCQEALRLFFFFFFFYFPFFLRRVA